MTDNLSVDANVTLSSAQATSAGSLERLRAAARTLFVRDGFHKTRPQDIVREAGVANGTFYLHFRDKQAAFLDFAQQAQSELLESYRSRLEGVVGLRERWTVIINTLLDFSEEHPGVLFAAYLDPVFLAPEHEDAWQLYDRMGYFIAMAAGDADVYDELAGRYNVELLSHAVSGMLRHAMICAWRKQIPREELVAELVGFIDHALAFEH